jgi:putative membrane protein insertion efficiency factor
MWMIRALIRCHQWVVSPILLWLGGPGSGCRFEPSCSRYFLAACETHGMMRGTWLGLKRLARCQPWGGHGFDPVPPNRVLGARTHRERVSKADSFSKC